MRVRIHPDSIVRALLLAVDLFVLAHFGAAWIQLDPSHARWPGAGAFVRQFDLDREANLPALFSVALLAACSALLAIAAARARERGDPFRRHWAALALVFLALAVDEGCELHELVGTPLRNLLGLHGYLHYAWIVPGALFAATVALLCLRFLAALPLPTRRQFLASAALYLGGALGIEMLSGQHAELYGARTFGYAAWTAIEESLEMLGAILFLGALMRHLGLGAREMQLAFVPARSPEPAPTFRAFAPAVSIAAVSTPSESTPVVSMVDRVHASSRT